jgi:alkylated DNA repair protein (DNA oxidative demethylase)
MPLTLGSLGCDLRPGRRRITPAAMAMPLSQLPGTGLRFIPGFLGRETQERLIVLFREVVRRAPLFTPIMPGTRKPFSVRMTNCGPLGWVSDAAGYRYQAAHPQTGKPWPPIPEILLHAWAALTAYPDPPQACLVNYYGPAARMGLHQDRDEEDFTAPVVSFSLGATCRFRIGGTMRGAPTGSFPLTSGDVVVLAGASRLAFHGVDRILAGTSTLVPDGGRINLTLRRVDRPTTQRRDGAITQTTTTPRGAGS